MNELLLFAEMVLSFGGVVVASRFFGKAGLTAWVAVATVLANVMTAKAVVILGVDATLGTVLFASTFLATDVLVELYGKQYAKDAVKVGMLAAVSFIVASQIALLYAPSELDFVDGPMHELFALNLRISVASVVMFFIANMADVWMFSRISQITEGKYLWLRNNVATITCNCLENFGFAFLAFGGVFPVADVMIIALSTSAIEIVAGLCDTPFMYLARYLGRPKNEEVSPIIE